MWLQYRRPGVPKEVGVKRCSQCYHRPKGVRAFFYSILFLRGRVVENGGRERDCPPCRVGVHRARKTFVRLVRHPHHSFGTEEWPARKPQATDGGRGGRGRGGGGGGFDCQHLLTSVHRRPNRYTVCGHPSAEAMPPHGCRSGRLGRPGPSRTGTRGCFFPVLPGTVCAAQRSASQLSALEPAEAAPKGLTPPRRIRTKPPALRV